ncbi:MAG: VIT1/CCC1 transporter family protein, partial [Deltaproteobacteria bacterium]|nr:VIT1/CCC1 transporter family protein [Deltaproteobacteria bacterium]
AAVLGANDGLVSNLTLVMGVAGASMKPHAILLIGLAGLVAGSCAMAMGEWLSVTTSVDSYLREIEVRAEELSELPKEEREQLISIYRAKGLVEKEAADLANRLIGQDTTGAINSRRGLESSPGQFTRSAWIAAASSFLLFSSGAMFPVLPFLLLSGSEAITASIVLSGVLLFAMGAATSLFSGRNLLASGLRQLAIGLAAAGATYVLGRILGVTIGG